MLQGMLFGVACALAPSTRNTAQIEQAKWQHAPMNSREMAFVNAFITPAGRGRASRVLERRNVDRKARAKFHRWLVGPIAIEPARTTELRSNVTPAELLSLIGTDGPTAWRIISTTSSDATEVPSEVAIGDLFDGVGPVILCDESGTMALYGTEHPPGARYLLRLADRSDQSI